MICRAKINLTLHVGAALKLGRWVGYHPVESLVVFADFGDEIHFENANVSELFIDGPFGQGLNLGSDNLVMQALEACRAPRQKVRMTKNIPVSAGLGGGSANAAAVLRTFDSEECIDASTIGADVPVCRLSQTAMMEGIGEDVTPISGLGRIAAVLVNPGVAVSTAKMFVNYDALSPLAHPKKTARTGTLLERAHSGVNDLQDAAMLEAPVIADVLDALSGQVGCQLARMSGSGATCFGLFNTMAAAKDCADRMRTKGWWSVATWLGEEGA